MKILITGAIGHIGSYLVRHLATQFPLSEIVMVDNLLTQRFPSLFNLPSSVTYRFIEGDVTKINLSELLEGVGVVVHLAAMTDAAGSFDKADLLEANNYKATLNVAEACAKAGVRLIALSSTSVYGTQQKVVSENCSPSELNPQSPYAITKLREEQLISQLSASGELDAISCRFGTIFGASPGMRFHTAVNKFCWQAVMRQPITVWSTAYDQKRPYLDIIDAARAITFIIRENIFDGGTYNILTKNATVREIVDVIREFVPDLEIDFVDSKIMNQLSYEVSCEKFVSKGFTFAGDLRRGIGETVDLLRRANN